MTGRIIYFPRRTSYPTFLSPILPFSLPFHLPSLTYNFPSPSFPQLTCLLTLFFSSPSLPHLTSSSLSLPNSTLPLTIPSPAHPIPSSSFPQLTSSHHPFPDSPFPLPIPSPTHLFSPVLPQLSPSPHPRLSILSISSPSSQIPSFSSSSLVQLTPPFSVLSCLFSSPPSP